MGVVLTGGVVHDCDNGGEYGSLCVGEVTSHSEQERLPKGEKGVTQTR